MPKVVDHDERRQTLIEVVWRLIATEGLDAVTTRRIAACRRRVNTDPRASGNFDPL